MIRVRGLRRCGPAPSSPLSQPGGPSSRPRSVLGAGWEAVLRAPQAGAQQDRKRPARGGGERKEGAGAGGDGRGSERRAGNAPGTGLQSRPVAVSGPWRSAWSPTSISGRTCFRGCGRSGRRPRALGPEVAAQVPEGSGGGPARLGGSRSYLGAPGPG